MESERVPAANITRQIAAWQLGPMEPRSAFTMDDRSFNAVKEAFCPPA